MRHAPPDQHPLRHDEPPDGLCDAKPARKRGRVMEVAASAKDAAIMLILWVVISWEVSRNSCVTDASDCTVAIRGTYRVTDCRIIIMQLVLACFFS